jgi:hypothetical protein
MDPVSMIVEALVAGASSALKDSTGKAVKDAYEGLKALLVKYWKPEDVANEQTKETEAKKFLHNLEEDSRNPEQDSKDLKLPLKNKLAEIMPNPNTALIEQAQQLQKLLDEKGFGEGKYLVTFHGDVQGIQTGDHNRQKNVFK